MAPFSLSPKGGGGGTGVLGKRWMCNVCRKLHVTHTASLAHAASHTDSSFIAKPQLVDVVISRKAFSRNTCPSPSTSSSLTQQDMDVKMDAITSPSQTTLWSSRHPSFSRRHSQSRADGSPHGSRSSELKDFTDISHPVSRNHVDDPSLSSNSDFADNNENIAQGKERHLADNVAYNISKTNNLSWRLNGTPYQSNDQKTALEKSIDKLYSRRLATEEPRVHEILIRKRQSMKNLKSSPTRILRKPLSDDAHDQDESESVIDLEAPERKRKADDEEISVTKILKLGDKDFANNEETNVQYLNSRSRVHTDAIEQQTVQKQNIPQKIQKNINIGDTSNVPSCSKNIENELNTSKSKAWSLFEQDWDDEEDIDALEGETTNTVLDDTSKDLSTKEQNNISGVTLVSSDSRVVSRDAILDDWTSPSLENDDSTAIAAVSLDVPPIRSIDLSSDSNGSSVTSLEENKAATTLNSLVPETSLKSKKILTNSQLILKPSSRPVRIQRIANKPASSEVVRPCIIKSHFSQFIENRASSISLDRRRSDSDKTSSNIRPVISRAGSNSRNLSNSNDQSFSVVSVRSTSDRLEDTATLSTPCSPNVAVLDRKTLHSPQYSAINDEMKLFDCGSAAEEAYDATQTGSRITFDTERFSNPLPEESIQYQSEASSVSYDTTPQEPRDDTIMKTASNLGLFDTGFDECRLHEVDDCYFNDEPGTSMR